jgi:lipoyl(octanoyl) transferase
MMLRVDIDVIEYSPALELQHSIVDMKLSAGGPDVLLLLQHPSTITLGRRSKPTDLLIPEDRLAALGMTVHRSDRGGQATFHGPGQLVAYPVMDLKSRGLSAKAYVHALEETVLQTLRHCGVKGFRRERKIGVWAGPDAKIASIGVRIRRGIAYHGFALNVDLQEDPSRYIVCCGMPETRFVSVNELAPEAVTLQSMRDAASAAFSEVFGVTLKPCSLDELRARLVDAGVSTADQARDRDNPA